MANNIQRKKDYRRLINEEPSIKHLINMVYKYEAGRSGNKINYGSFNENSETSTAFGAGQFTAPTRKDMIERYDIDPWSSDINEQELAMVALLEERGVLDDVRLGNYEALNREGLWQTFKKDFPGYEELNAGVNPATVDDIYNSFKSSAVFEPKTSLKKISPEVWDKKNKLFKNSGGLPVAKEQVEAVFKKSPLDVLKEIWTKYKSKRCLRYC